MSRARRALSHIKAESHHKTAVATWGEDGTARSNYNKKSPVAVASPRGDDGRDVSRNSNEALGREGLHVKTPAIHRVI